LKKTMKQLELMKSSTDQRDAKDVWYRNFEQFQSILSPLSYINCCGGKQMYLDFYKIHQIVHDSVST
jgi:hypothetical protein